MNVRQATTALIVSALILAACGGDDDSSDGNAGGATTAASSSPTSTGGSTTPTTAEDGGVPADADTNATVRLAVGNTVNSLDPHLNSATYIMTWYGPAYETLILATPDGTYHPQLATEWEFDAAGTTFDMTLRDDVVFHDGTPFNAAAVKANIERARTIQGSLVAVPLAPVSAVEVVDDTHVRFRLSAPFAIADVLSDKPGTMASPAAFANPDFATHPVGTGPFKWVSYQPGIKATYERFDDYWGEPAGVASVEITLISDSDAAFNALRGDQIDVTNITETQMDDAEGTSGIRVETFPSTVTNHVNLDIDPDGKFGDQRVRYALAHATDHEAFAEFVGGGAQPTIQYALPSTQVYDEALDDTYPYDPDEAKALLTAAGFPNGYAFELHYTARPVTEEHAQVLQEMWRESGFDVTLVAHESTATVEECLVKKVCDALLGGYSGRLDLAASLANAFVKGARLNVATTEDPDIVAAIAAANQPMTDEERVDAYKALNETVVEVLPSVPLNTTTSIVGVRDNVIEFDWALNQHPLHGTIYVKAG